MVAMVNDLEIEGMLQQGHGEHTVDAYLMRVSYLLTITIRFHDRRSHGRIAYRNLRLVND
jgi:hypothetical protein